jgi:hypothetical protein
LPSLQELKIPQELQTNDIEQFFGTVHCRHLPQGCKIISYPVGSSTQIPVWSVAWGSIHLEHRYYEYSPTSLLDIDFLHP